MIFYIKNNLNFDAMRKLFTLFLLLPLLTACEKDPDLSRLDSSFVVTTDFDINADFRAYSTYYIPDSILVLTERTEPVFWTANGVDNITNTIIDRMNNAGYTRVANKEDADLGLQTTLVQTSHHFITQQNPYWWWGHPGFWRPGYWGSWGSWRYPFVVRFTFRVGSLLVEMVDLKNGRTAASDALPVVWSSYMTGLMSSSDRINVQRSVNAVNEAFNQSPNLMK